MEPLVWPRPAGRLKRCFAIFSLDKINVGPRESDPKNGARRTSFPATIRQTYKSDGGPNYPWSGMQDMITVKTLARAIEKRLGGTGSEALAEARTVMSYFGFRTEIIDNAIQPEDRKLFYSLHDAGLIQTFWETVPLLVVRN